MADKGLFDGYDLAIMIHADAATSSPAFRSLAMDGYRFTFRGRPAHAAAAPWEGVNALNGVQLLFHALDMLRQHIRPEARIHGVIDAGGAAPNIVPEGCTVPFRVSGTHRDY
jgi:metal-dependent amidase/aminoacylase/carboxypeptidase family protein